MSYILVICLYEQRWCPDSPRPRFSLAYSSLALGTRVMTCQEPCVESRVMARPWSWRWVWVWSEASGWLPLHLRQISTCLRYLGTHCSEDTQLRLGVSKVRYWSCPSCVSLKKPCDLSRPVSLSSTLGSLPTFGAFAVLLLQCSSPDLQSGSFLSDYGLMSHPLGGLANYLIQCGYSGALYFITLFKWPA